MFLIIDAFPQSSVWLLTASCTVLAARCRRCWIEFAGCTIKNILRAAEFVKPQLMQLQIMSSMLKDCIVPHVLIVPEWWRNVCSKMLKCVDHWRAHIRDYSNNGVFFTLVSSVHWSGQKNIVTLERRKPCITLKQWNPFYFITSCSVSSNFWLSCDTNALSDKEQIKTPHFPISTFPQKVKQSLNNSAILWPSCIIPQSSELSQCSPSKCHQSSVDSVSWCLTWTTICELWLFL